MNLKKKFKKNITISNKASYKVAKIIAKELKPHTIAENLILPACSEIVQIMFSNDEKKRNFENFSFRRHNKKQNYTHVR